MFWPCETRTSICRNLATISSGLYRFLAITVLLDVKDIPQVGPLQWGWIIATSTITPACPRPDERDRKPGSSRLSPDTIINYLNRSCFNKNIVMARRVGLGRCEVSSFCKAREKTLLA